MGVISTSAQHATRIAGRHLGVSGLSPGTTITMIFIVGSC